jgi:hypothetical protein
MQQSLFGRRDSGELSKAYDYELFRLLVEPQPLRIQETFDLAWATHSTDHSGAGARCQRSLFFYDYSSYLQCN